MTLIRAIALLDQHQRPRLTATVDGVEVTYIEVTREDILLANRLAGRVLGRSLDELPPGTRRLLDLLGPLAATVAGEQGVSWERVTFTRRELREHLGWGDTQLKVHLARLVSLELVHAHRAAHGQFVYQLAFDAEVTVDGVLLPGLINPNQPARAEDPAQTAPSLDGPDHAAVERREHGYDGDRSGPEQEWSGAGRGPVAPGSGPGRPVRNGQDPSDHGLSGSPSADQSPGHGSQGSFLAAEPVTRIAAVGVG